ncbi:MAG: TonB-dependent receptor, partial [Phycisphaerales bacterium]|nr:TonB-dependent receptor [Phycisphaerales bacterium]
MPNSTIHPIQWTTLQIAAPLLLVTSLNAFEPEHAEDQPPAETTAESTSEQSTTDDFTLDDSLDFELDLDAAPDSSEDDLLELDESLDLLFEDFDIVISASRTEQSSNMTPVPVSILNADDIRYSGVRELPELFAYIPGVDALKLDKNRWAVGVRGLHQTFSDRTLFLLNGRHISNPVHGGVDFQRIPLFLDDIKQIETVRGPGGAAWGANAFNGVINIIEKDPKETTGLLISQRVDEFGDSKTNLRFGDSDGKLSWRFSAQYNDIESTDTTHVFTGTAVAPARPKDFLRSQRYDFDAVYDIDDSTAFDFGIGGTHLERGDSPFLALQLGLDERIDLIRAHAKLSKEYDSGASSYLQWYGTYQDVDRPSMFRYNSYDNNIDGQYSFKPNDKHHITVGGTARTIFLNIKQSQPTDALPAGYTSEHWLGVFASDSWSIDDEWTLESQIRLDWYSETSLDWSGRVALLHALDDSKDHILRIAAAKAFRTPQTALRDLDSRRIPVGGGLFGVNLIPAFDIDNEQLYSLELGYTAKLDDGFSFRTDAYAQHYDDLTGAIVLPEPAPVLGRSFFTVDNIGSASAVGSETELKYQNEKSSASIWYAYNDFDFEIKNQNARAFRPARHKVGLTGRTKISDWLVLNANYRYT